MKSAVLIVALVLWSGAATAQRNDIVTGPHGGKLQEVAGVEVELLVGSQDVTLCVYSNSATLLDARKYEATVTIVSGASRERIALRPTSSGRLHGAGGAPLRPYSSLTLDLTTPAGLTGRVEF